MAGHSKFKNIMHRKGAQDVKRAKMFNKLAREISVAAKSGLPDPAANPRLRAAIIAARTQNMPKDRIDRAIKSGSPGGDDANYEEVRYEGYGPGGIALIVEALTDNRNRTASDLRSAFSKFGGAMGETGSVSFQFERGGVITYKEGVASEEAMMEAAIEAGASDVETYDGVHEVTTSVEDFTAVRDALEEKFGAAESAKLEWWPNVSVDLNEERAQSVLRLVEVLDDHDDVQNVYANFEVSDEIANKLSA